MIYTTTAIAYFIISFVFAFLVYRVFRYWREGKDAISEVLFYISFLFLLFMLSTAIRVLFFVNNPLNMQAAISTGAFLQAVAIALLTYFIFLVKFPGVSRWPATLIVLFLGFIATYLNIFSPFKPFIESSGAVNWGYSSVLDPSMIIRACLGFFTFIPTLLIFWQQYREAEDSYIKKKTIGFSLLFVFGIIIFALDFLIINIFKLDSIWRDLGLVALSLVLAIVLISTRIKKPAIKN